jgi:hypothetical protein
MRQVSLLRPSVPSGNQLNAVVHAEHTRKLANAYKLKARAYEAAAFDA